MSQSRRHQSSQRKRANQCSANHRSGRRSSRFGEWRETGDRALEVFICVGHIIAVVTIVVEHLM